jgi:predicted DNA-binding helix-hairpin-helix protein
LRDYGFSLRELPFDNNGNLSLSSDPKLIWAEINLSANPVEVNTASYHELLRLPGFGPKSTSAIMNARRQGTILDLEDLKKIGVNPTKAAPFLLLNGSRIPQQIRLI